MANKKSTHVLLLSDQARSIKNIEQSLLCDLFRLYQVDKVRDALTMLDYKDIDVILCDLDTEKNQGLECFNLIFREFSNIPIIVLSDESKSHLSVISIREGAQDFVLKSELDSSYFLNKVISFAIERASVLKEIKASEKKRSEFLAQFSHEIRTPLNAITGMSSLLEDRVENCEQRKMLATIQGGAERILHIMNNISEISRIESNEVKVNEEQVLIRDFIRNVVMNFSRTIDSKIICADIVNKKVPKTVMIDRNKVQQNIHHLLCNASKFTESGFITVEVNMNQAKQLYIGVEDTGCGISSENQKKLFHPFSQIKHDKESFRGTGLGLIRCKKTAELLGGKCGMSSRRGKGSLFWFTVQPSFLFEDFEDSFDIDSIQVKYRMKDSALSIMEKQLQSLGLKTRCTELKNIDQSKQDLFVLCHENHDPNDAIDIEKICIQNFHSQILLSDIINQSMNDIRRSRSSSELKGTPMNKVIVVDDEMVNRKIMVKILKSLHIEALTAANGEEAISIYNSNQADVIFMDCFMPIMDGYEATQKLREQGCQSQIIALTAHALDENKQKCFESGMDDFLTKPVSIQDIRSVFDKIMNS
ncbi:MAG: response regulator [Oligoflexales bacterium]